MGKHLLRNDTECQNCGRTVEQKYCPNCGQKNTETRQSFHHLFTHFIEDFTHYDGAFWKTIKYLLFRPARLTKEYLIGKRQAYVAPVKLYIFISFLTFLIISMLPSANEDNNLISADIKSVTKTPDKIKQPQLDKVEDVYPNFLNISTVDYRIENPIGYKSVQQMDSIEATKPDSLQLNGVKRKMAIKLIKLYEHNTASDVGNKFASSFGRNLPKALFFYLPVFAFWLWLFHGKKRWYFFDHGIFTLHYFSFLLLTTTLLFLVRSFALLIELEAVQIIAFSAIIIIIFWQVFYFFRAHRKMYGENLAINVLKGMIMFFINMISIITILVLFGFYTLFNLH